MKSIMFLAITALLVLAITPSAVAEIQTPENISTITPINDEISLQKIVTTMTVPENNKLPWGFVKGGAADYVERYPVIIQFFKGEDPVHVAQVDVKGDGSYEYKFRVRNVDHITGEVTNIFEGQYTVKIFKVIHNSDDTI